MGSPSAMRELLPFRQGGYNRQRWPVCSHSTAISADQWPDDLRLSDIEDRFTCTACGKRGDVRPDFNGL